ncbi:MAG: PGF-pre-PGF domain-containing protein [archaeon]
MKNIIRLSLYVVLFNLILSGVYAADTPTATWYIGYVTVDGQPAPVNTLVGMLFTTGGLNGSRLNDTTGDDGNGNLNTYWIISNYLTESTPFPQSGDLVTFQVGSPVLGLLNATSTHPTTTNFTRTISGTPLDLYVNITVADNIGPLAPSTIAVIEQLVTDTSYINISWSHTQDNIWTNLTYAVYRSTTSDVSYTDTLVGTTSYNGAVGSLNVLDTQSPRGVTYYYAVYANDTSGNRGANATSSVTVTNLVPAQVMNVLVTSQNNTLNVSWDAVVNHSNSQAIGADLAGYRVYSNTSGIWALLTTSNQTKWGNAALTNGFTYYFKIAAYDLDGNGGQNSTIAYGTPSERPGISASPGDGSYIKSSGTVGVTITSGNPIPQASIAVFNSTANAYGAPISLGGTSPLITTLNATSWKEGDLTTVYVWANDSNGQENQQNFTYTVDDTLPTVLAPATSDSDDIVRGTDSIQVNVTAADSSGIATLTAGNGTPVSMANPSGSTWTATTTASAMGCTAVNGPCVLKFTATDNAGNINNSATLNIQVDDVNPTNTGTAISDADNVVRGTQNFQINITSADTVARIANVTVGNATQVLMPGKSLDTFFLTTNASAMGCTATDGNCTLRYIATDNAGNINNTVTYTITVDDTNPSVVVAGVNDSDGIVKSTDSLQINVTVTDTHLSGITLKNGSVVPMSQLSGNTYSVTTTASALGCTATNGYCTVRFNASDSLGNRNETEVMTLTIDDVNPRVTALALSDADNLVASSATFAITAVVTDTHFTTGTVTVGNSTPVAMANTSGNTYSVTVNASQLGCAAGTCMVKVTATDDLGNINSTETLTLTVDDTVPSIAITYPTSGLNTSSGLISFTVTDNVAVDRTTITVKVNGAVSSAFTAAACTGTYNMTCSYTEAGLGQGSNEINITASDNASNAATRASVRYNYDTVGPVTTVYSPISGSDYVSRVVLNWSAADAVTRVSAVGYYLDGATTFTALGGSSGNVTLPLNAGTHRIKFTANDTLGNRRNATARTVRIIAPVNITRKISDMRSGAGSSKLTAVTVKNAANISQDYSGQGALYVNRTLSLKLTVNISGSDASVDIPSFDGLDANWDNAGQFQIDVNRSSATALNINTRSGATLKKIVLMQNMENILAADKYTQGATIFFNDVLGSLDVVYIADDIGDTVYKLPACSGSAPTVITLSNMCYINTSTNVTLYVPHLSGGGLVNDTSAPTINITSPVNGSTVADSYATFGFTANEANPKVAGFCTYSLRNGSNAVTSATLASTDLNWAGVEGTYSATLTGLADETYTVVLNCTDLNNRSSQISHNFTVADTTVPRVSALSTSTSGTTTVTLTLSATTNEAARCRYAATDGNYTAMTAFSTTGATSHSVSIDYTADASGTFYVRCNDTAGNAMSASNSTTFSVTVTAATTPATTRTTSGIPSNVGVTVRRGWDRLEAGIPVEMLISKPQIPLTRLTITTNTPLTGASITVKELKAAPSTSQRLSGTIYKYIEIDKGAFINLVVDSVVMEFKVPKTWMTDNGVSEGNVVLYRHESNVWTQLPTEKVSGDADYVYYRAASPGLSYFAVGQKTTLTAFDVIDIIRAFYAGTTPYTAFEIIDLIRGFYG